jgi:hypothetical protein
MKMKMKMKKMFKSKVNKAPMGRTLEIPSFRLVRIKIFKKINNLIDESLASNDLELRLGCMNSQI